MGTPIDAPGQEAFLRRSSASGPRGGLTGWVVPAMGAVAVALVLLGGGVASAQVVGQVPVDPAESSTTTSSSATSTSTTTSSTTAPTTSTTAPASATTNTTAAGAVPGEPTDTTTTLAGTPRPAIPSAVGTTEIPVGSVLLAAAVLLVMGVLVALAVRRRGVVPPVEGHRPPGSGTSRPDATAVGVVDASRPSADATGTEAAALPSEESGPVEAVPASAIVTHQFLLEVGRALIDAGDTVDDVHQAISRLAAFNGLGDVGVVVLPTALMISVPSGHDVQTEVRTAGHAQLRLDQADEVFRLVDDAERGLVTSAEGLGALQRIRRQPPLFSAPMRLFGATLLTAGLVFVLGGSWLDLAVAAVLGLGLGAAQVEVQRRGDSLGDLQVFFSLVAAFAVAVAVFALGRVWTDLAVFVPLVAALVTFLPGRLLTTGVLELSTGQLVSGTGRLASGGLQLALLAIGIVAGARLVGVPATSISDPVSDVGGVALAWLGVGMFGLGVFVFHGSRRSSLAWMMFVLYVAYAGQVVGGVFFGGVLSAFFGALAMTPVAVYASRRESGPPMLVAFLPGFWLLVPGALGLEGVTQFLGGERLGGIEILLSTVTTMIGIAFGVLLGTALATRALDRFPRTRSRT